MKPFARELRAVLAENGVVTEVLAGEQAACELAALDDVDQVTAAIVGACGAVADAGGDPRRQTGTAGQQRIAGHLRPSVLWTWCGKAGATAAARQRAQRNFSEFALRTFSVSWDTLHWTVMMFRASCLPVPAAVPHHAVGTVRR